MKPIIFLFVIQSIAVFGQNPYSVHYSIDEGLPTSNIYSAFEDSKGYIWFGTDVGVLKFHGQEFQHFSIDDGLSDNEVFNFYEDKDNRLWFLTLNGELSYFQNGKFYNSKNNNLLEEGSYSKIVMAIYENEDDHIILYRDGTEVRLNFSNETVIRKKYGNSLYGYWKAGEQIYYLVFDAIINIENGNKYSFIDRVDPSKNYRLTTHQSSTYFSIGNTLYEFSNDTIIPKESFNNEIIHMRSIDEKLWLGTRNGLVIKSELSHQLFFESDAVSHIIKDSQNNYWVTTLNNGIRFIPNLDLREYQLSEKKIKVNDIITASNEIFAGTERGLFKIEKSQQSEQSNYSLINNDYIKRLRFYDDKLISIGNESIKVYDKNEVQNYTFGANDCYFNGSDYFFSSSVVFKFSESEMRSLRLLQNINSLKKEELEKKTLLKKRTNIIYPSNNDAIILGTSQGLFQYNNNHLTPFVKGFESLNASIKDIKSNKKNNELIVATNSKGLTILKENSILHHISKKQELSSNTCNSIEVVDNTIYVGTNVGIDKITYDDNAFDIENMNTELGLKKEKINDLTIKDSILFIATDKGLLSYNLISGNSKVNRPTLVIDSVLVNNSALPELDKLKSSQNNITVNFTGISFADYGEIKYQYRINNNNWIALDGTVLAIKNISSGSYEIDLRARGNQNIWSDTKRISLTISPPFYKSVPFILLIVISLLLAINFIIRKRIKSLKQTFSKERKVLKEEQQKIQIEKQMLDLEQKALRMQMNPHFIFNALNTIKGYYAAGNIKEANTYISQLSKLLRLILENDERLIPIEKEIEIISLYIKLIQLRYIDVFDYEIIVNPNINKTEVGIPTLILQPLVENAIIHGLAPKEEKGLLTITFDIIESKLICKVIDDGIGYTNTLNKNKNKSGNTSKALKITKERIEIENNDTTTQNFIIKDRVHNTGTEVIIKLPVLKVW